MKIKTLANKLSMARAAHTANPCEETLAVMQHLETTQEAWYDLQTKLEASFAIVRAEQEQAFCARYLAAKLTSPRKRILRGRQSPETVAKVKAAQLAYSVRVAERKASGIAFAGQLGSAK